MENCSFCGNKNFKTTKIEYTYKQNDKYLLINDVPCIQCEYCGEKYFEAKVLKDIEHEFFKIYNEGKKTNTIAVPIEGYEELKYA
jgi:YgiT-type zinc finger domain-containing protein